MRSYCLACKRHTFNKSPKNVIMTNKVIRNKSNNVQYAHPISHDLWDRNILKMSMRELIVKKVVIEYYKTSMLTYCLVCKRNTENKDIKMIKIKNGR